MKIIVLQPPYSENEPDKIIEWIFKNLYEIKENTADLILLPEYSNCPGIVNPEVLHQYVKNNTLDFLKKIKREARRLNSLIAGGIIIEEDSRWYNRGVLCDRNGEIVFYYDKIHLTDMEKNNFNFISGDKIPFFKYEGINFGFALCFDIYFPEYATSLAEKNIDIILNPSYQRAETPERIKCISQTRCIDSGAYLIRSSYAMGEKSTGGHSLICSPSGEIIIESKNQPEILKAEINSKDKWLKPSSYGQPEVSHIELIKRHRKTYLYYPFSKRKEMAKNLPFPRICAHRGLSGLCPENTLPSFASAIASGCDEIEMDIHTSKDGVFVVCHDETLERTTNGKGKMSELNWSEIRNYDAGVKFGDNWEGIKIPSFEEVVALVDYRVVLNIHIKFNDFYSLQQLCNYIKESGLVEISYLAIGDIELMEKAVKFFPEIERCCLINQENPDEMVRIAKEFKCKRVQFFRNIEKEHIEYAHSNGIICNLFYSNDLEDAKDYLNKGIDVILTDFTNKLIPLKYYNSPFANQVRKEEGRW